MQVSFMSYIITLRQTYIKDHRRWTKKFSEHRRFPGIVIDKNLRLPFGICCESRLKSNIVIQH